MNNLDSLLFDENIRMINSKNPEKDALDVYMLPYEKGSSHNDSISDVFIKNKLQKINSSLKSFNIVLQNQSNTESQLNQLVIDTSNETNKNSLINALMDLIIDLIWKYKEETSLKETLVEKLSMMKLKHEELEKKLKRVNLDLENSLKEKNRLMTKTEYEKEKLDSDKKNVSAGLNELRIENKKLSNMVALLKNEIKKKEVESTKIGEKYKSLLMKNSLNYRSNLEITSELKASSKHSEEMNNLLNQSIAPFNYEKMNMLINQNLMLFAVLNSIRAFLEKFTMKGYTFLEKYSEEKDKANENYLKFIGIKENLLSIHLLEQNMLNNFYNIFMCNIDKFDEVMNSFFELSEKQFAKNCMKKNSHSISNSISQNQKDDKSREDMLKNFKKWGMGRSSITDDLLGNNQKSKWFENYGNSDLQQVNYVYEEENVIKCDNDI